MTSDPPGFHAASRADDDSLVAVFDALDSLNALIEACKDGEFGCRVGAEHARSAALRRALLTRADEYPTCTGRTVTPADSEAAHIKYLAGKVDYDEYRYASAIAQFRDAYARDCHKHELLIIISRAYELNGDRASAIRALETYLERFKRARAETDCEKPLATSVPDRHRYPLPVQYWPEPSNGISRGRCWSLNGAAPPSTRKTTGASRPLAA